MGCSTSAPHILEKPLAPLSFRGCYDVKEQLGAGSFGQVMACVHKATHTKSAVKILRTTNSKQQSKAEREGEVWTHVGEHKHIVVLLHSFSKPDVTYFVMQRCRCSMFEMLKMKGDNFCHGDILDNFYQVFLGLQHCHQVNVVHRDIKASNLLVDFDGTVKISDFGLSTMMAKGGAMLSGIVGSVPYMSCEMVKGRPYGFKTDIWSCGAVIYFLAYGEYPYESASPITGTERKRAMMKAIATNSPKPKYAPANKSAQPAPYMKAMIEAMLQRKLHRRPDADACVTLVEGVKAKFDIEGCDLMVKTDSLNAHKEVASMNASRPYSVKDDDDLESTDSSLAIASGTDSTTIVSGMSWGGSSQPVSKVSWGGSSCPASSRGVISWRGEKEEISRLQL